LSSAELAGLADWPNMDRVQRIGMRIILEIMLRFPGTVHVVARGRRISLIIFQI